MVVSQAARVYENESMESVRMDKWLWAARFFKTRALAVKACELGQGDAAGAAWRRRRGMFVWVIWLRIKNEGGEFEVAVLVLSEVRGPAAVAQTLYRETEQSKEARLVAAAERKATMQFEILPAEAAFEERSAVD